MRRNVLKLKLNEDDNFIVVESIILFSLEIEII